MKLEFGQPKELDSITKEDVLTDHVWVWTWEAGLEEEYDEDWQVPVRGISNVTDEFTEPIITLRVVGTDLIASGSYNPGEENISGIATWENEAWQHPINSALHEPIILEAMVKINNEEGVQFILESKSANKANRK